jgi:hypothetical protein
MLGTAAAWIMIRLVPYRIWRSRLGTPVPLASSQLRGVAARVSDKEPLKEIAWAHGLLARLFGKQFTCLMLAFSARGMLRRRKMPSLLVLGVKRSPGVTAKRLGAHAWVLSGNFEVVGGDSGGGYAPIAAYSDTFQGAGAIGRGAQ